MAQLQPLQGQLQTQIMGTLWRIERGTVEEVRRALPPRHRGAYTTVQTVLNRLADRGLLRRTKVGNAMLYRPLLSESEYLSRTIERTLAGATGEARRAALAQLIGDLHEDELSEVQRRARQIAEARKRR